MKKFTKIMLSVAAATAVSAAMAVSAMAAVEATYDSASGVVTLTGVESSGDQQTLLVLSENKDVVTEDIIKQIDQDTSIATFVLEKGITSGTYYIRIGGTNGTIQECTLTIGTEPGPGPGPGGNTKTLTIGDVNGDGEVGAGDALFIARYNAQYKTNIGAVGTSYDKADSGKYVVGDVNGDGEVGAGDALFVARYNAQYKTNIGQVGTTVEVVE